LDQTISFDDYEFTYYEQSGGLVVTREGIVCDAGIVETGEITRQKLNELAHAWVAWYHWYLRQAVLKRTDIYLREREERWNREDGQSWTGGYSYSVS
jgi:hypothetical protein